MIKDKMMIAVPSNPTCCNTHVVGSTGDSDKLARNRYACKKYRENNKEKIKEKRIIVSSTTEFKKQRNEKLKENRSENPLKYRERQKRYILKNPDKVRESQRKYKLKNPDKRKSRKRKEKENQRKNITNEYVKILLSNKLGIAYGDVKKYPKLIELHREIIKIKRYAKQNEN